jgi:hypothetical protein
VEALCSGNWQNVCTAPPQPSAAGVSALRNVSDLISPVWRTTSIYRDEERVPGLPGYLLQRSEQRKLFLAGAEEARLRCFEIAELLGLPTTEIAPHWREKLLSWCSPTPTALDTLCKEPETQAPRICGDALEPLGNVLTATCSEGVP